LSTAPEERTPDTEPCQSDVIILFQRHALQWPANNRANKKQTVVRMLNANDNKCAIPMRI